MSLHEAASVRHDEAQEASTRLLTSLDELRNRADNFLTVAGSTAAIFASLAGAADAQPRSVVPPVNDTGYGTNGNGLTADAATGHPVTGETVTGETVTGEPGVAYLLGEAFEAGTVAPSSPRAITSSNRVSGTVGRPLSFTVMTSGDSVPSLTHRGELVKGLRVFDNGDGTATISGKPKAAGVHRVTIRAKFGKGANKYVVAQSFTVNVEEDV